MDVDAQPAPAGVRGIWAHGVCLLFLAALNAGKRTEVRLCRKLCRFSLLNVHIPHISSLGRPFSLHCCLEFACLSFIYPLFLPSVVGLQPCLVHQVLYITLGLVSRSRAVSSLLDFFTVFFFFLYEKEWRMLLGLDFPWKKQPALLPRRK